MRQIRLRRVRRRLGLYQPPAPAPKPMDPAAIRQRRRVFETLPEHPVCPEGWTTGPPDFVIFGAQKSGTTWWFRLIEQHPGIVQPKNQRPELHFFDRLWAEPLTEEHIERYHRYFPRPADKLVGEKTPEYMNCAWVPPMVKTAAPASRAIVLLRDPVDRYISGLSHMDRGGLVEGEDESGMVRVFGDRVRVVTDAVERGMYATQVDWLQQQYEPERLLVMQYEACAADPAGMLARTFDFLDLPPFELPAEELARPRNKAKLEKVAVPESQIEVLKGYYQAEVERLGDIVPDLDLTLWPHFRDLA